MFLLSFFFSLLSFFFVLFHFYFHSEINFIFYYFFFFSVYVLLFFFFRNVFTYLHCYCSFIFYDDPKVAACTIPIVDGKILLLKRGIEPGYGKWVFPGGFLDRGERVEDAAIRETWEEAGLEIALTRLLNVYSYTGYPVVVIVYLATVLDGTPQALDEPLEAKLFTRTEIPWQELAFPSTRDALSEYISLSVASPE